MIGDSNLKSNDGIVHVRMGSSDVYVTFDGGSNVISVGSSNWVRIEYNNINWVNKTLDFVVKSASGSVIQSLSNKSFWSKTTSSVSQVHLYNTTSGSAYFDGLIMSE